MDNSISNNKVLILIMGIILLMASCEYQEYADAEYPDQIIYMPSANYNIYEITKAGNPFGESPTEGDKYRYLIDSDNGKFIIPLGVYRAGINNNGDLIINIEVNNDTITKLISEGQLDPTTIILPSDQYTLDSSVTMPDGEESVMFNLSIDLNFLQTNAPIKYSIGVGISSEDRETNPELNITLILIDTNASLP